MEQQCSGLPQYRLFLSTIGYGTGLEQFNRDHHYGIYAWGDRTVVFNVWPCHSKPCMIKNKLDEGEEVVVIIRRHWILFASRALMIFVIAVLPLIGYGLPPLMLESIAELVSGQAAFFIYLLFLLFLWTLIFIDFTMYHLNIWIVTNRRIIDVHQRSLFERDTITLMLEKIQDATVEVHGLFATMFNYGTLIIHTAGVNTDITIYAAANPQFAKDRILECERMASEGRRDGVNA